MRLKVTPEDFQVEERVRLKLNPRGSYSIYRLEKKLWNTLDALDFIARKHHLAGLARAGLKDRYSHSIQYISARGPGPKLIQEKNFSLKLVGRSTEPITHGSLLGNRFRITLRDLSPDEVNAIARNLPAVMKHGFANYYDEQRFGSARHGAGFIAQKLILGHYNGALKLYLATPSSYDDSRTRRIKAFLLKHWGDWHTCLQGSGNALPQEYLLPLRYLEQNPKDFEGAVRTIRHDFLEMFLNAYQSFLWNETLAQLIVSFGMKTTALPYSGGELLFYLRLPPKAQKFFAEHEIPVASPQTQFTSERIQRAVNTVLIREGLTLRDMKLKLRIKGLFFKPFTRPGIATPIRLQVSPPAPDELYRNRQKLTLAFTLGPGSYATILIKRLLLAPFTAPEKAMEDSS